MLMHVADRVIAAEPVLTDADRQLGDGDHGLGMQRGMTALKQKLDAGDAASIDRVFSTAGMAMISSMGGASGVIFGTMFRSGGAALAEQPSFGARELAEFLAVAVDAVMERGKARPGDKTMVDALHPAADRARQLAAVPLVDALDGVAIAAEAGVEATKPMVAKIGRAQTLGERAVGHPDAGAISIAVILRAMHEFVASRGKA